MLNAGSAGEHHLPNHGSWEVLHYRRIRGRAELLQPSDTKWYFLAGLGVTSLTFTGGTESQDGTGFDATIALTSFSGPGDALGESFSRSGSDFEFDLLGQPLGPEVYDSGPPS